MDIQANLSYLAIRLSQINDQKPYVQESIASADQSLVQLNKKIALIDLSSEYYKKAVDLIYERSIGEMESVVNSALLYIFPDKPYSFKINLEDKRGKSIEFCLIDNSLAESFEVDIKDGTGAGIREVISFVIHFYYLYNQTKTPIMFVDEEYTKVSDDYIDRLFSFIKTLCETKGLKFVLISHDLMRIREYADKIYVVKSGTVEEVSKG